MIISIIYAFFCFSRACFFSFVLIVSIFYNLSELNLFSKDRYLILATVFSFIFAVFYTAIRMNYEKKQTRNKMTQWLSIHFSKLVLVYIIVFLFQVSFHPKIIWNSETFRDNISLQWGIFGISITIFVIWSIVVENMEEQKSKNTRTSDGLYPKQLGFLKKLFFFQEASLKFNTIFLLRLSFFTISGSTILFYTNNTKRITLFSQNATIFSFLLCITSLGMLFYDIITLLKNKKDDLLTSSRPSNQEFKDQNQIAKELNNTENAMRAIWRLNIDEKTKKELTEKLFINMYGEERAKKIINDQEYEEENNDDEL